MRAACLQHPRSLSAETTLASRNERGRCATAARSLSRSNLRLSVTRHRSRWLTATGLLGARSVRAQCQLGACIESTAYIDAVATGQRVRSVRVVESAATSQRPCSLPSGCSVGAICATFARPGLFVGRNEHGRCDSLQVTVFVVHSLHHRCTIGSRCLRAGFRTM